MMRDFPYVLQKTMHGLRASVLLAPFFYCVPAVVIAGQSSNLDKAEEAIPGASKLLDCFVNEMKRKDKAFTRSKAMELFLFDIVTDPRNSEKIKNLTNDESRRAFCKFSVEEVYFPLYIQAKTQRIERNQGTLGPLGGLRIETESPFIDSYYNLTGREAWGHSDITRDALSALRANRTEFHLTVGGTNFLLHASQVPDLYHWSDETFHAHTPGEEDPELKGVSRNERIAIGQKRFRIHIHDHMLEFLEKIRLGDIKGALIRLGTISHGVQDLVYHHGMTLGQHAGLAYAGGFQNPDYPKGEAKARIEQEARNNTSKMLLRAMELAGKCAWKQVVIWPGLGVKSDDSDETFSKEFWNYMSEMDQDIGYLSLISYWGMSIPYWKGGPKREELKTVDPELGVIRWNSKTMMDTIVDDFANSEEIKTRSAQLHETCSK